MTYKAVDHVERLEYRDAATVLVGDFCSMFGGIYSLKFCFRNSDQVHCHGWLA
jgi:hypothetical protein